MKGLLSKIEYVIIGIFVLVFLIWAVSRCNSNKEKLQEKAAAEAREDSLAQAAQAAKNQPVAAPATEQSATGQPAGGSQQPTTTGPPTAPTQAQGPAISSSKPGTAKPAQPAEPQYSKLYVTIDKLKIRKTPGLKGDLLGELKLFDEVFYMNEVTDSTYQLSLGKEIANEPYIKVKTKRGTVGWVYGAGVHYIKKKRPGTLE